MDYYSSANATKRGPNKYQLRLKFINKQGEWDDISKTVKDVSGKKEAKRLAEEWRQEMNEALSLSPNFDKDKTVGEVVLDYIEYQYKNGALELSSYTVQKRIFKLRIEPYEIADIHFISLDRTAISIWLTKLNSLGLAQGTIRNAYKIISKVYAYYYRIGELNKNPFVGIKSPKDDSVKVTHLTPEQAEYFLECAAKTPLHFHLSCLLAYYAGLRRGEICGLRWRDVDLNTGYISIHTAIGVTEGGTYTKQPKTKSSERTFPMVPQLYKVLKEVGYDKKPEEFVVGNGTKYYNTQSLSNDFIDFTEKYGLVDAYGKRLTLHSLRHNLGTVGINSGMDIASLSKMLGHSSRAMTLDVYGDSSKDAMIVATEKLGEQFKK